MIVPKTPNTAPKSFTTSARESLYDLQLGMCPWCGEPLHSEKPVDMSAHHRLLRTSGGTWSLANIIGLHPWCHNVQPRSVHQEPKRAYELGFMILTHLMTPAQIPFYVRWAGQWWLPDTEGGREIIHESLALELLEAAGAFTTKAVRRMEGTVR